MPDLAAVAFPLQLAGEMKAKGIERNVHTYTVRARRQRADGVRVVHRYERPVLACWPSCWLGDCWKPLLARPACCKQPMAPTHPSQSSPTPATPTHLLRPQVLMNVCIKCSKHTLALDTYKLMRQDRCTPNVVT